MTAGATLGLDASRAVDPVHYAIGQVTPHTAIRPANRDELLEALSAAARDSLAIVPWGGGVAAASDEAPPRYDLAIDLAGLNRVVEYEPQDLSLTAECGATIAALRASLAAHGQELPLEAAHAGRATLGGVLAANASGPRRLRLGAPRDRILGASFALANGTLARSGGKVVKSVAGYATHRLLCGSRGGLAIIVEVSLKLLPAPAARRALIFDADQSSIADPSRWVDLPRLEPAVLTVLGAKAAAAAGLGEGFAVIIGLEGDQSWVEGQTAMATQRLGRPSRQLAGDDARALWQSLADLEEQPGARLTFTTAHNTPNAVAPLLDRPESDCMVFHATAGRLHVFGPETQALAMPVLDGFARIGVRGAPSLPDPEGPETSIAQLRARVRAAMDPAGGMAWGGRWERWEG